MFCPSGGSKSHFFFAESSHVACQINGNEAENIVLANSLPFNTPTTPRWGQKVKIIYFLKKVMLHIKLKGKDCRTLCNFYLMHTPDRLGLVKRSDNEIMQKVYLIELSELVVFSYDQSDIKGGLRCWRNQIYILWLTSSPYDKNSGERSRAHGPSC